MDKKLKIVASIFSLAFVIGAAFCCRGSKLYSVISEETQYELTLEQANRPVISDGNAIQRVKFVDIMYSDVLQAVDGHVMMNNNGLIANEDVIHGILDIVVLFESSEDNSLTLFYGDSCLPMTNETTILSGIMNTDIVGSTYFLLQAQEDSVKIISLVVSYSCLGHDDEPSLPKINITTSVDAQGHHQLINSREVYTDSTLYIDDSIEHQNVIAEENALECQIKIRGNSTSAKPKKPYRIKLAKKRSLFGYAKAKNYVLLAEYMDGSALHNFSVYSFANAIPGLRFTPTPKHVEVYINGMYNGLYVFAEQLEAKEGRLDIEQEINSNMLPQDINIMFEMDASVADDPTETIDQTYFAYQYSESKTMYYALKYPEMDECSSEEQYYEVFNYLKQYVAETWQLFKEGNAEDFANSVDSDSLTAFALIDTIFNEADHATKSFKMYRLASDGKLYFGPIWDYDSCSFSLPYLGIPVEDPFSQCYPSAFTIVAFRNTYFQYFVNRFSGLASIKALYNSFGSFALSETETLVITQAKYISHSLSMNANLWFKGDVKMVFENLKYTNKYLHERKSYLDIYFA